MLSIEETFATMSDSTSWPNDICFIDGQETRLINVPDMYKELGVASDENVNRIRFACPRIVGDNVDLTNYNIYVNYRNAAGELNSYLVEDVDFLQETNENIITFSWLLSRHVTAAPGIVQYIVCAKKSDGTNTTNEWNTKVATGTVTANDIEPVNEIEEQNADIIEQILTRIDVLENGSGSSVSLGIRDAEIGKSVQIKSVDSNGQPTAWETFDTYDNIRSFLDKEGLPGYAKKTEIPTKVSELENDSGYLTEHQSLVEYAKKTEIPTVPTKVSELQNDSGYLTEHQSLVEYAKKTEIPTIPESLKNPNALTIKVGDTTTTYDGSEAKMINVSTGESIPSYWLTHLQTKADKIHEVMEAAGRNKSSFLFYTDVHWNAGEKKAPMLLKYLYNNTPINKTIFGGDIVQSESTDRNVMKYLWEWRKQIRELPNHHSVVGNHDDGNGNNNNMFSTDYIYSFLLAAEETPNIVQGGDMYYYIDEPCEKTRYLYLDTAYIGIKSNQTTFIKEALKTTPNKWHIVAISHIWYAPDYDQYNVKPIPIAGYGTGVESVVNLFDDYNARQGEFSSCTAKVEFCMGGHCHRDYVGRTTGGIPIILCETDSHHNRSGLTDTVGTTTESSVNAIIANYSTEKINVIRIGRGENFEVPLHTSVTPPASYTNLIPTSIDTSGNVYNSSGYKTSTYIDNNNGTTEIAKSECWCTGLIPITNGDVIRIKYVFDRTIYNDTELHYFNALCFYNEDKSFNRFKYLNDFLDNDNSFISGRYEWSGTNFEGTLTFTFDGASSMFDNAKYIRVSSAYFGSSANMQTSIKNAVITINEEIN